MQKTTTQVSATVAVLLMAGTTAWAQTPPTTAVQPRLPEEVKITFPQRVIVAEVFTGPIVRIVDGETLVVERETDRGRKTRETVRLFGLKRPSAQSPDNTEPARRYLTENLKNKKVRVEGRHRQPDGTLEAIVTEVRDRKQRRIGIMQNQSIQPDQPRGADAAPAPQPHNDTSLNILLVRLGLARFDPAVVPTEDDLSKRLADAEDGARKDKNGLWATSTGTAASALQPRPK